MLYLIEVHILSNKTMIMTGLGEYSLLNEILYHIWYPLTYFVDFASLLIWSPTQWMERRKNGLIGVVISLKTTRNYKEPISSFLLFIYHG